MKFGAAEFAASGPSGLVLDAVKEFKSLLDETTPEHIDEKGGSTGAVRDDGAATGGGKIPFALFMKRDWPNQAAQATAIFTWAKRYDGKDRLKPGEMSVYWKKIDKKPGNPTMACQGAEKKGWLESVGNGYYALLGHGENMVEAMPSLAP